MKSKAIILILFLIYSLSPIPYSESASSSFSRNFNYENQGYKICYKIVQGENLQNLFTDLGFDIDGSLTDSNLYILIKNKKKELRDIYYIESNKSYPTFVDTLSIENYIIVTKPVNINFDTNGDFMSDLIGYNYNATRTGIVGAEIPANSTLYVPSIFTDISRPNFASLINELNFFDFLPLVLDTDYDRYEAEFSILMLNSSFSVNIYNQGYDDFTVSLEAKLDFTISVKAVWNKESGLLKSLLMYLNYENKSSSFVLTYEDCSIISSPADDDVVNFFITNSDASYEMYKQKNSTEDGLIVLTDWFKSLNQSNGLKFVIFSSGLDLSKSLYIYNPETKDYYGPSNPTPLHRTIVSLIEPCVLPTWQRYAGYVTLIQSLFLELYEKINGFQFEISDSSHSVFTLEKLDLRLEYTTENLLNNLLWDFSVKYQENNTLYFYKRNDIQEYYINSSGWLSYSAMGKLLGFSMTFNMINYWLYDNFDELEEDYVYEHYYHEIEIESIPENLTIPGFPKTTQETPTLHILEISFYVLITCAIWKKKRKMMGLK